MEHIGADILESNLVDEFFNVELLASSSPSLVERLLQQCADAGWGIRLHSATQSHVKVIGPVRVSVGTWVIITLLSRHRDSLLY